MEDKVFWLSVFKTIVYTAVASILKFALGLWLAIILNESLPFKTFSGPSSCSPGSCPTVLSALAFWWIFDSQFSIISWVLMQWGVIDAPINFLGDATNARLSVIAANVWRGIPFVAISLLAGSRPSGLAARGGGARRRDVLAAVPAHHPAAPDPHHRGGDDILGAVHLHDFQLIYVLTKGGPVNATPDGDAVVPARHSGRALWAEGAAIAVAMVPFLLAAILFSFFRPASAASGSRAVND